MMHDSTIHDPTMYNSYLLYIEIIHDIKGRKNILAMCKDLVSLAQKIVNKVDQKRDSDTGVFSVNFVKFLITPFSWNTSGGGFYFF